MNTQTSLVLLVGLPFSGKTFLGKKLEEKLKYIRIAFDETWQSLEADNATDFELSFESVTEYIKKLIQSKLSSGESVIYDSLNDTPDQRDMWKEIAKKSGSETLIVFLDTPIEEIKSRRENNIKTEDRHQVDDELFDNAIAKFIPPTKTKSLLKLSHTHNLEEWIKENF